MWSFEQRFVPPEEIEDGFLAEKWLLPVTLLLWLLLSITAFLKFCPLSPTSYIFLGIAPFLARMIAIDLRHFLLPDIYTLPFLVAGLMIPALAGWLPFWDSLIGAGIGFGFPFIFALVVSKIRGQYAGLGGGDIKMIAACGAWLGWMSLPFFIVLACIITLAFSFVPGAKKQIPFGPGLCLALWIQLLYGETLLRHFLQIAG